MNKIRYRGPRRAGTFTRLAARLAAVAAVGTSISLVLPGPAWAGTSTVAGYQASTLFGLTSASATFTVPKITCTSADANTVELLGLFNLHGLTVEPLALGGPGLVAAIAAGCTGTTPGYNVNEYVNGAIDDGATVNAGDVIVVSMSQTATTEQVLVKDGSRSWPASYVSNDDTAIDFGVFHECFPAGPPCPAIKFGTANFSAVRVNTAKLSRPPHAKYNLTSPATGHTLVATSKIGSSGDDFTLTFMNATRPRSHT